MNKTSKRHRGNKCHGKNIRNYQEQGRNDKKLTKEQKKIRFSLHFVRYIININNA